MARNLVWADLTAQQLENIRHPHPKKGWTGRDLLSQYVGITDPLQPKLAHAALAEPKNAINLDLYVHTLQYGQELKLADDKLSGLFSLVKQVHLDAVEHKLTLERSFAQFKELLLAHSVQRPPYSIGLFTYAEMTAITEWMLDTYYRHYTLYQYVFTDRVTLTLTSHHPLDCIEVAPLLQPLILAMTEKEHDVIVADEQTKQEAADAAAAAQVEAEAEAARQLLLRKAYEAAVPEEIKDRVQEAVDRELALMKVQLEEQFTDQTQKLLEKINILEAGRQPTEIA